MPRSFSYAHIARDLTEWSALRLIPVLSSRMRRFPSNLKMCMRSLPDRLQLVFLNPPLDLLKLGASGSAGTLADFVLRRRPILPDEKESDMKIAILAMTLLLSLAPMTVEAQEIKFGEGAFEANFEIDSSFTTDGKTFEVSASGEAGPYGRAYASYIFTEKQDQGDRGEFTGFVWTQQGEDVVTATVQGVYKKDGKIFRIYSLDNASNGKFNIVSGEVDFVAKTMKFKVSELQVP